MSKAVFQEKITAEIDGISYTGNRTIVGTHYASADNKLMDCVAQLILIQLVTGKVQR